MAEQIIAIDFNSGGHLTLVAGLCLIPLLILGGAMADKPANGRNPFLLFVVVLLYGVIFTFQLYDQFFWITVTEDRTAWIIEYPLSGAHTVKLEDFDKVISVKEAKGARIIISTRDGRVFRSAKISRHRLPVYEEWVRQYKEPPSATKRAPEL